MIGERARESKVIICNDPDLKYLFGDLIGPEADESKSYNFKSQETNRSTGIGRIALIAVTCAHAISSMQYF